MAIKKEVKENILIYVSSHQKKYLREAIASWFIKEKFTIGFNKKKRNNNVLAMPRSLNTKNQAVSLIILIGYLIINLSGCATTVKIEAPDKPITVDLNVKVEHSIDVKVDEQVESVMGKNPEIF